MGNDRSADIILEHYAENFRLAGGPRVGYVLRKQSILRAGGEDSTADLESGLAGLVDAGLVKPSESGDFYFLTAAGVEKIGGPPAPAAETA